MHLCDLIVGLSQKIKRCFTDNASGAPIMLKFDLGKA
jgi:hypothetical protein